MKDTLIAVDIGNTHIIIGIFEDEHLQTHWRIASDRTRTIDEYGVLVRQLIGYAQISFIRRGIIASVVPRLSNVFCEVLRRYLEVTPLVVSTDIALGIQVSVDYPAEVGADRLVNAVAVCHLYTDHCIVVDFGTATTFDLVSKDGIYLGGVIAPGIQTSADNLFEKAAQLYRVSMIKPSQVLGKSTVTAIQSGIFYGALGQCDEIIRHLKAEWQVESCRVVATGGLARFIASESSEIDEIHDDLTLLGLKFIANQNP